MLAVLGAAAATPAPAPAQRLAIGASLWGAGVKARTTIDSTSTTPAAAEALSGPVLGFDARVSLGRWGLRLGYGQGSLDPDTLGLQTEKRDYVDGFIDVSFRPLPTLEIGVGPYARAYTTDRGTQRWSFWQLRARYEAGIITPDVRGYAELWGGFAGTVNAAQAYDGSRGGAAGLQWRISRLKGAPVTLTIGYLIDEARAGGGTRRETVERTWLALGVGRI
jgi:hypothetical protein